MNELSPLTQVPPFLQGESSHGPKSSKIYYILPVQINCKQVFVRRFVWKSAFLVDVTSVLKGHRQQKISTFYIKVFDLNSQNVVVWRYQKSPNTF